MVVPFFILSDNWQQDAITSYIILVEKISGECCPYSFVYTSQHLGHPTNIYLGTARLFNIYHYTAFTNGLAEAQL